MSEKELKVRIQQKHDIEANWIKAVSFVPKAGEIIIYDADDIHLQPRIKIGNGITAVSDLDFVDSTDSTIPAWAKEPNKPTYTKSEVGLGNVDNVRQYSASNSPIVVQDVAPTDTSVMWVDPSDNDLDDFSDAVNTALAQAKASGEFDGPQGPKGDTGATGATGATGEKGEKGDPGGEIVPDYVVTEAMSVLDKVISAQGNRTFVLGAVTDMHYGSDDYTDGVLHACQGMKHISERIKLDAVAVLGDYTDEHQMDTDTAVTDLEEMNALLDRFRDTVNFRLKGNHDHRPGAEAQTYRYIAAYSDDVVWGSRIGGYFYRDFSAYKLRIIGLNTTETARDNLSVSDAQYKFFASALDLSEKEDVEEWGILILSHHPLDWTVTNGAYRFGHILDAYQNGKSWTGGVISCNYSGKNGAKIICNLHGHIHNLLSDKIYVGEPGNSDQTSVWRMCVPASRVDYVNHYSGVWVEGTWYSKTKNTAEDTSFNIICIDLDSYTIKAFCYGAGYDRELTYHVEQEEIINLIDTVGYTNGVRYSATSHGTKDASGYVCTGEIQLATGDVLRTSGVNFDAAEYNYANIACIPNSNPTGDSTVPTNSSSQTGGGNYFSWTIDNANNLTITGGKDISGVKLRLTGYGSGANLIVTKNQEIV